jgi:glutathione reductase (NADPH)
VRAFLADEMRKKGIDLRTHVHVERIARLEDGAGLCVTLRDGTRIEADSVLYATGRHPNTAGLGLEEAGVALSATGAVVVDEHYQSNVPSVYAIGDVIDKVKLTPVALAEAMAVVDRLYGDGARHVDYALIPTACSRTRASAPSAIPKRMRGRSGRCGSTAASSRRCATRSRAAPSGR